MFNIKKKIHKFNSEIKKINKTKKIEELRIKYLGKKGYIKKLMNLFKKIPKKLKPKIGKKINKLKKYFLYNIKKIKKKIKLKNKKVQEIDISLPGKNYILNGSKHPITITLNKIENFFEKLGFENIIGKEIENKYYNFDALNIPKYHPSRNKSDTFWINKNSLLRTQTSCMQIRYMKKNKPPIKIISSGCVFRKDNDCTHTPMFHQLECFLVDKNINFCNLKYIIYNFINFFFKKKTIIKFIPSYFPFTKPSAEILIKNNKGKWIEILGCGLIHPKIFKNTNINYKKYSGLAFGIGIERLTMLKYNINDIRILYKNNIDLLNKF